MRNSCRVLCLAPALLLASVVQAQSSGYTFERIDAPGAVYTYANSINNHGTFIGTWSKGDGNIHSYIARNGEFQDLVVAIDGAQSITYTALNDREDIIGNYTDANFQSHGFLRRANGQLTLLDAPNAAATQLTAINNRGDIVGGYGDGVSSGHAFLYRRGSYQNIELSIAGASNVAPSGINNRGTIIGSYTSPDGRFHAFVRSNGRDTTLEEPNTSETTVRGISDSGLIVGSATTLGQDSLMPIMHVFLYDRGRFTDLVPSFPNEPPQAFIYNTGIDVTDAGVILAQTTPTRGAITISWLATCD